MVRVLKPGICHLVGLLVLGPLALAQAPQRNTIQHIEIRGNRRIPEDTIRFYIQAHDGDAFDPARLELDLRALYKANFFETISIDERDGDTGKIVTFVVKEKPLIRSIEYPGAKSFTESNILDHFKQRKVGLTVDSQYDPAKIRMAERALKELLNLNGKPLGTVHTEIENIPPSSVRVRFVIDEGPKVRIGQIKFVGDKVFHDGELKDGLKLTKERGLMTIFKGTDKYHREKLEADIEMNLKQFYKEHGYIQVQIGEPLTRIFEGSRGFIPMFRKTKQQFYVEIPIDAGDQYRISGLKVVDSKLFKPEALERAFGLKKGDVANFKKIKDALEQIKKLYGNYGYINMSYLPEQNFDEQKKTMDLTFRIVEDRQFFVNQINFTGNTKTRDKVMRREFLLEEGKVFSSVLLDQSILRLNQLGFFERIEEKDYNAKPDDKTGTVDVGVKVKERSQQSIGLTGGVSGISGSFLGLNYTTNNFRGRGESFEFSVTGGTRTTDLIVSFTEPYLFDTRTSMGLSVFNQRYRFDTFSTFGFTSVVSGQPLELFTQRTTGSTLTLSRPLRYSFWRLGASYTYQRIGIGRIAAGFQSFALNQLIGFAPGGNPNAALKGIIRSEVTPMLSYNSTNHFFNPTRGSSLNLSVSVSGGILGGDFSMIRPSIEFRHFIPDKWLSHRRNTVGFRFLGQYIQAYGASTIPFFDRFFIGGETTIRGFDIRSISPMGISFTPHFDSAGNPEIDLNTGLPRIDKNLVPVGGDTLGIVNAEYRIPIAGPLSVAAFYDIGITRVSRPKSLGGFGASTLQLIGPTNSTVRGSTGAEIQFLLPVISAPFRLIFAFNPQVFDGFITLGTSPLHFREPRRDIKFTIGRSF
ncbi:MAG: outer membrane protein assembly factor BamA [Acidobacteria bacterium]|nr:MAG: outer membrane protein assembly factor BamA [Acidobacteriota bacterium]